VSEVVAALRRQIQELEGRPITAASLAPTGCAAWDAALGGLPRAGVVEVIGPDGAGRTRLALSLAAAVARRGEVAWVDAPGDLGVGSATSWGVPLDRLVVLRPPPEHTVWAVEQLLRAGAFSLVVADPGPLRPGVVARWARASQAGQSPLVLIPAAPGASAWRVSEATREGVGGTGLPAADPAVSLRLEVQDGRATVLRSRLGGVARPGQGVAIPAMTPAANRPPHGGRA
jgi:hypothetical protein